MESIRNCINIMYQYPHWDLSMSQIKQHLKHLDAQKQNNINRINIFSKDNETIVQKRNQNYSNVPLYVPINIDKILLNIIL